ncbi:acyl-CoA dehydrogenase family protein [Streptomyces sp. NRRL S-448]|uniref:acyl-CoA dehydrogenase family protein n=1 Tax=Streptomyces sp. NRRL S-448 TaxID=1463907 RepID=UPI00356A3639
MALAATPEAAEAAGGGGWRLSGEKCWISNAPEADFYTVFARTGEGPGAKGVSAFLVPADRPGLSGAPWTCSPRTRSARSSSTGCRSARGTCSASRGGGSASRWTP